MVLLLLNHYKYARPLNCHPQFQVSISSFFHCILRQFHFIYLNDMLYINIYTQNNIDKIIENKTITLNLGKENPQKEKNLNKGTRIRESLVHMLGSPIKRLTGSHNVCAKQYYFSLGSLMLLMVVSNLLLKGNLHFPDTVFFFISNTLIYLLNFHLFTCLPVYVYLLPTVSTFIF